MNALYLWATKNSLSISAPKSFILPLGKKHPVCNFTLGSTPVPIASNVRDLGVHYDTDLSFAPHVSHTVRAAKARSNMLLRAFRSTKPSLLSKLYTIYVRPIVEYATQVWSPHQVHQIDLIEDIQRSYTRRVMWRTGDVPPYEERLQLLQLQPLSQRRVIADLTLLYNIVTGRSPLPPSLFQFSKRSHVSRSHALQIVPPLFRTNHKFCFSSRVVNLWNSLPREMIALPTSKSFGRAVSAHLATAP